MYYIFREFTLKNWSCRLKNSILNILSLWSTPITILKLVVTQYLIIYLLLYYIEEIDLFFQNINFERNLYIFVIQSKHQILFNIFIILFRNISNKIPYWIITHLSNIVFYYIVRNYQVYFHWMVAWKQYMPTKITYYLLRRRKLIQ